MLEKNYINRYRELIREYVSLDGKIEEADAAADPAMAGADPAMAGADPAMAGADPAMAGADPAMAGADPAMAGADPNAAAAGADPNAAAGANGFQPQPEGQTANAPMGGEQPEQGQEEQPEEEKEEDDSTEEIKDFKDTTEKQIDKLTSKFEDLIGKLDKIGEKLNDSDSRLESLKADIEKRNPTPEERLSMRSVQSGPFNEKPEDYWKNKMATSNYSVEDDNNGEDMEEYQIKKSDIDGFKDWTKISKSFDDERMGLRDILGY